MILFSHFVRHILPSFGCHPIRFVHYTIVLPSTKVVLLTRYPLFPAVLLRLAVIFSVSLTLSLFIVGFMSQDSSRCSSNFISQLLLKSYGIFTQLLYLQTIRRAIGLRSLLFSYTVVCSYKCTSYRSAISLCLYTSSIRSIHSIPTRCFFSGSARTLIGSHYVSRRSLYTLLGN